MTRTTEMKNASELLPSEALSVKNQAFNQGVDMSDSNVELQKSITISSDENAALSFNDVEFSEVLYEGKRWLQSADIARALGYANDNAVARIYARNEDEFTADMTEKVKLTLSGNLQKEVRIFSLRGAHLLAMFARTKVAKAFRKWVLDVLDREVQQQAQEQGAATAMTPAHDSAFAGMVIAARRKMVVALADFERQMAVWEIVDEQADKSMPTQQVQEICARLDRLGKLFHPFSDQFVDVLGISRALRGLDPRMGASKAGWVEVLPKIAA